MVVFQDGHGTVTGMTDHHARRSMTWEHGTFSVERLGAMLGPVAFRLPGGHEAKPLHLAPWAPAEAGDSALLRGLRGEWPCIPFGYTSPGTSETPPEWADAITPAQLDEEVHGYGSNHDWAWQDVDGAIALRIDYPDEHPIQCVHRSIAPDPTGPALDFTLSIQARVDAALPLGLHFTFRLPPEPGSLNVEPGRFREGRTYPGVVEPGSTAFAVDSTFSDLSAVPAWDGGTRDVTRLPFDGQFEELLQLNDVEGRAAVAYPAEGFRARIKWDPEIFPSLLLWISNRGRSAAPWSGRHLALGMEPVRSPFGLGPGTAAVPNPLSRSGTPTAWSFRAGEVLETRYRLSAEAI